jgi:DNA-binding CsgD family transcriptional regulator
MHLSTLETRQLSRVFELLSQPAESAVLRQRLIEPLASLAGADYVVSLVWNDAKQQFGDGVSCAANMPVIKAYEAQYQFSDPLAATLRARHYPTLVTQIMPQRELVASEFFNRFLQPGKMHWGLNIFAHDGQRDVGDFRIWRSRARGNFDAHTLEILRFIYPSMVNALSGALPAHHINISKRRAKQETESHSTQQPNQHLAHQYGLSKRELQIANCVSQGLSDKEIAKAAGIGFTTVRTYLSQALKKTHCSNRKELIACMCSQSEA